MWIACYLHLHVHTYIIGGGFVAHVAFDINATRGPCDACRNYSARL